MSPAPALYLVADRTFLGSDRDWLRRLDEVAEALAGLPEDTVGTGGDGGVMLQLRVKGLPGPERRRLLAAGLEPARTSGVPVLLNGTAEEARELGFDGAHWPERLATSSRGRAAGPGDDRSTRAATGGAPDGLVRGASVHSADAARAAAAAGADFLVFGPVYAPGSKPGAGVGVAALEEVVQATGAPVLAIGGVTARRARVCRAAGAWGVAVVSAVFAAGVPAAAAVRELRDAVR